MQVGYHLHELCLCICVIFTEASVSPVESPDVGTAAAARTEEQLIPFSWMKYILSSVELGEPLDISEHLSPYILKHDGQECIAIPYNHHDLDQSLPLGKKYCALTHFVVYQIFWWELGSCMMIIKSLPLPVSVPPFGTTVMLSLVLNAWYILV